MTANTNGHRPMAGREEHFADLRERHPGLIVEAEMRKRWSYEVYFVFDPIPRTTLAAVARVYFASGCLRDELIVFGNLQCHFENMTRNNSVTGPVLGQVLGIKSEEAASALFDFICARIRLMCAGVPGGRDAGAIGSINMLAAEGEAAREGAAIAGNRWRAKNRTKGKAAIAR